MPAITVTYNISDRFLASIFETALSYHGIRLWAGVSNVYRREFKDDISTDRLPAECTVVDVEDPTHSEPQTVTLQTIANGIQLIMSNALDQRGCPVCHPSFVRTIGGAIAQGDTGDIDVEVADVIIQVGLFGRVIYG